MHFLGVDGPAPKLLPDELRMPREAVTQPVATVLSPEEYLDRHRKIARYGERWMEAVAEFSDIGDAFTLYLLNRIDEKKLKPDEAEVRQRVKDRIAKGRMPHPEQVRPDEIGPLMIRAAMADLRCDPLETLFSPWLIAQLKAQSSSPEIRRQLEALRKTPLVSKELDKETWGSVTARTRQYIDRILAPEIKPEDAAK